MAKVYFKKQLANTALGIIKVKGAVDKKKAKDDMDQIDAVLTRYNNGYSYNAVAADQLDRRLRREYPVIKEINQLPSPRVQSPVTANLPAVVDPIISNLNQDRYGIMFDVLFKEGLVHELEDFVDRVE